MKNLILNHISAVALTMLPQISFANSAEPQLMVRHIDTIQHQGQSNYAVHTPKGVLSVVAPAASDLAGLANMDSLSQDWICEFTYVPANDNYTSTGCTYIW